MSLSFNVKNAGLLSQIGFEIVSLNTAIQLATGAYGWWKAQERSQSLNQILAASGGELIATSSLNLHAYRDIREHHGTVQGVVAQDGVTKSTPLGKASTAVPQHPGTACLRALATGLLCYCDQNATVEILQHLIPATLLQLDQSDRPVAIDGPLLASLKQWVTAVASEEDSNSFRTYLTELVAHREALMAGLGTLQDPGQWMGVGKDEMPHIIGMLEWMLTPAHRRELLKYPTRSLKVWSMALVMSKLGFDICAYPSIVTAGERYDAVTSTMPSFEDSSSVFLVACTYGDTDPWMFNGTMMTGSYDQRPQITALRAVPSLALRRLRHSIEEAKMKHLVGAWNAASNYARKRFGGLTRVGTNIQVRLQSNDLDIIADRHQAILAEFSPHLHLICGRTMRDYVPTASCDPAWDPPSIREGLRTLTSSAIDGFPEPHPGIRENCYTIAIILLGTVYGFCSQACYENGRVLSEDSEIAFAPDILYDFRRFDYWIRDFGFLLNNEIDWRQWSDLVFELFLGMTNPDIDVSRKRQHRIQRPHLQNRYVLGAQSNGMTAVSSLIVNLTVQPTELCYFHVKRGQILNVPLTEEGYIEASKHLEATHSLTMNPEPQNDRLFAFDDPEVARSLRLDVEPCWEADPRTVVFRIRRKGLLLAPVNIAIVLDRLAFNQVLCDQRACHKFEREVTVPVDERWQLVSLYQLYRQGTLYLQGVRQMSYPRVSFEQMNSQGDRDRVLVDASMNETATIYAVGIIASEGLKLASECLACAHKKANLAFSSGYEAVIVIPWRPPI